MEPIVVPCPAKVNLTLRVVGKRPDGYHDIDSVMVPLTLADTLIVTPATDGLIHFTCDDPALAGEENLVVKAARGLKRRLGEEKGARLHLEKRIPVAAGLGGGSSDAAGTLRGLLRLWGADLPDRELLALAASLGADVPFFLDEVAARAEGIGERLTRLGHLPVSFLVLVKPAFGVSSADAYRNGTFPLAPDPDPVETVADLLSGIPRRMAMRMVNDLEPWVMRVHPELETLRERMARTAPEPVGVLMSGSGPTLFALYRTAEESWQAEAALKNAAPFVKAVMTA